jgi:sporulation protein YlmC with PRC-barrel domain
VTMKAKAIKGFPVVSLEDGSLLGKVQELLVDPLEKKVEALLIGEKGFLKGRTQFISYGRVRNIGKDVITAEPEKQLTTTDDHTRLENLKKNSFLGNSVISQDGDYLARVQDYTFNTRTGIIESLLLYDCRKELYVEEEASLGMEGVLNLGRDYVIVRANYSEYLMEPAVDEEPRGDGANISHEAEKTDFQEEEAGEEGGRTNAILDKLKDLWSNLEWEISREGKNLARETREKMKKYALGKKASYTVRDNQGYPLITAGETIDENTIHQAEAQEKIGMLFLSAISQEVEDGVGIIGDKISSFFRG